MWCYIHVLLPWCHGYRPYHPMGDIGTCQIYDVSGDLFVFIPQVNESVYLCKYAIFGIIIF